MTIKTQAELDRIFKRLSTDYNALNKKQQAFAIREIGRVRGELSDLLAEYADKDGIIARRRIGRLSRDLDILEDNIRKYGEEAFAKIASDTADWTTQGIILGLGVSISSIQFNRTNRQVVKYVTKRFGEDGLVLSDRVWDLAGSMKDDISSVIRSNIIRGEGINAMIPQIRKVHDNETWKIRRLARTEGVTAHRAATSYNAQASDLVKWVQFHDGTCGHKNHETHACYPLAQADKYSQGKGIYKPTDTEIWLPHPNCSSWITYVLDERWL